MNASEKQRASKLFFETYTCHFQQLEHAVDHIPAAVINAAADSILACNGKVVFTGMGKSGLVAKKAAATFSSLGTPAIFLHAAEALHGDLGLVQKQDLIIAIAKSGESQEILATIENLRQKKQFVISIVSEQDSSLAKLSDLIIPAMVMKEADPLNLAPTASTTVAFAICDALAVTIASLKKFRPENFHSNHPSGFLGKQLLLLVKDLLHSDVPVIDLSATVMELLKRESKPNLGGIMITNDQGQLIGLVTDGDLRRAIIHYGNILECKISDIMTKDPITITGSARAIDALTLMQDRPSPISVVPVIDDQKKPLGLLRLHDVLVSGKRS